MRRLALGRGAVAGAMLVAAALSGPATVRAQRPAPSALESLFAGALRFRSVGPWDGGRVVAVAGVADAPRTFFMGSTGGGVWRTTDAGHGWVNVSDGFFGSASVSSLAVAPSDANVVYAATGETCLRNNISAGDGVYRSDDVGRTWRHAGLRDAGQIGKLRVHPKDPDLVYAAVLGHAFGANPERGVFRSRDGGRTWQRILFVSERTGAVDLVLDESTPRVLYAAFWEVVRKPWTLQSGGPDSGLYKSADGGDTWSRIENGLPAGIKGKIGVAVSPAKPDRVWALVEALPGEAGLYRSDDAGASFALVSRDKRPLARAFYYTHLVAHPTDPETVFAPSHMGFLLRSIDGGRTFADMNAPGSDFHALWLNPRDPNAMIVGDDGGAMVSLDGGRSWSPKDNQPTAELYNLTIDRGFPWRLYGAQQDGPTWSVPSRAAGAGIGRGDLYNVGGGEHGDIAVHLEDPRIVYSGNYEGILERYDHVTGQTRNISAWPFFGEGVVTRDYKYRFAILAPVRVSPHDTSVLYHASQHVHRSRDEGQTWEILSPDLTRNDPAKQGPSGGPITRDHTGPEVYDTISALEESELERGVLWAGTDDGLVHVSRDTGVTWTNVTPHDMPEWGTVNRIEISRHAPGRVLLAVHRYRLDDFAPYVFRTTDYGRSWTRLGAGPGGIAARHFVRVVREDPVRQGLLYAGTEYGLYLSFDDGRTWPRFQLNLPVTPVTDVKVKDDDLALSTQGRGFFILDDLSPLRRFAGTTPSAAPVLVEPRPAWRIESRDRARPGFGQNPPNGALLHYLLPAALAPGVELRLEILDVAGQLVRSFSSAAADKSSRPPTAAGLHRFAWDLRHEGPNVPKGATHAGPFPGPHVPPGVYEVRLSVGSTKQSAKLQVRGDPRVQTTDRDFREQLELALAMRDRISALFEAHSRTRAVRTALRRLTESADGRSLPSAFVARANDFDARLLAAETALVDPRLDKAGEVIHYGPSLEFAFADLSSIVQAADARPTAAARELYQELGARLDRAIAAIDALLGQELDALEAQAQAAGVRLLSGPPKRPPSEP